MAAPLWLQLLPALAWAQSLPLPPRPTEAPTGTEFIRAMASLPLAAREERIAAEFLRGNVPRFLRQLVPVTVRDGTNMATLHVSPDYLAVGSDDDYFLAPMTPTTAQRIADATSCVLPTCKLVDAIYTAAPLKLSPAPIPPSPAMTTVGVFARHNAMVRRQRPAQARAFPLGTLVAGHKKDVVITPRLTNAPDKVAIYGWHNPDGRPIQPLYLGHTNSWVDYSHGVRLVQSALRVNGASNTVQTVLSDPGLASLLSDEGPMRVARYEAGVPNPRPAPSGTRPHAEPDFGAPTNRFHESRTEFKPLPDVRVLLNAPAAAAFTPVKPVKLVLYALPNGNTLEQTAGRRLRPGDDWHFDIQHIAAQTRWLRATDTNHLWVVAYLEAAGLSWPAWRRQHTNSSALIRRLVDQLAARFTYPTRLILTGHSGGGSFTFGYLNAVEDIPDQVERLAFLDSNYAYDPAQGHTEKLARWIKSSPERFLIVLAYDDANALLDGKPFVSAAGGTWGRSHLMLTNLAASFPFSERRDDGLKQCRALQGRAQFLLKENPDRKVLHTVQVERNGFIHALLAGTPWEGRGYEYLGARAYEKWIE